MIAEKINVGAPESDVIEDIRALIDKKTDGEQKLEQTTIEIMEQALTNPDILMFHFRVLSPIILKNVSLTELESLWLHLSLSNFYQIDEGRLAGAFLSGKIDGLKEIHESYGEALESLSRRTTSQVRYGS